MSHPVCNGQLEQEQMKLFVDRALQLAMKLEERLVSKLALYLHERLLALGAVGSDPRLEAEAILDFLKKHASVWPGIQIKGL